MKVHLVAIGALFSLDVFALGIGVCTLLVAYVMLVVGVIKLVRGCFGDRKLIRHGALIVALHATIVALTNATVSWQQRMADERAAAIVLALKSYKAQHAACPSTLGALVPEYLPEIPRAKYTLAFGDFEYRHERHSGQLSYTRLPPFSRATFYCDTESWGES
ncbi:MAG: hypothetical protein ACOY0T_41120 [Myxococcota bacterium]